MWRDNLKIYPLSEKENPPALEVVSGTGKYMNTIHANNEMFYDEINDVIQREPLEFLDEELRGDLASIGIIKGHPFKPDDRMKKILKDAAAIANATSRTLAFRSRSDTIKYYGKDSGWFTAFDGGSYKWLRDEGQEAEQRCSDAFLLHCHREYAGNGIGNGWRRISVCSRGY